MQVCLINNIRGTKPLAQVWCLFLLVFKVCLGVNEDK